MTTVDMIPVHLVAIGSIAASMAGLLPYIAVIPATIFYVIQIWESQTVQKFFHRFFPPKMKGTP